MARRNGKRKIGGLAALGIGFGVLLVGGAALAAAGGDDDKDDKDDDEKDGYIGPDPNLPPGKRPKNGKPDRKPTGPTADKPPEVAPTDLWIKPDCTEVVEGDDWLDVTATPAIRMWVESGYGDLPETFNPELSRWRIVREVIGPYSPLCIEAMYWADIWARENPAAVPEDYDTEDAFLAAQEAHQNAEKAAFKRTNDDYPQLSELAGRVETRTDVIASEFYGGAATA